MPYQIAVSSGLWRIAQDPSLINIGTRMLSVTTYGVNFVQVDMESPTDFNDPLFFHLVKRGKDSLGINWSLHGEIGNSVAWETAVDIFWKLSHLRLHQYLDAMYENFIKSENEKYKRQFINFHISNTISIGLISERYRFQGLNTVDFRGRLDWSE